MAHIGLTRHHAAFRESTISFSSGTFSRGNATEMFLLVLFSISRNSVVCTDDTMLHMSAVTSPWRPTRSTTNSAVMSPKNQFCCWFSLVNLYSPSTYSISIITPLCSFSITQGFIHKVALQTVFKLVKIYGFNSSVLTP